MSDLLNNPDLCWSADESDFSADSLGELLDNNDDINIGDVVYYAEKKPPSAYDLCDADLVLEQIQCSADDIGGEYAEDFSDVSQEAKDELGNILAAWVTKHCNINFWTVKNIKEYIVTADDIGEQS